MYNYIRFLDRTNIALGLQKFLKLTDYLDGTVYNCFFSVTEPGVAAGYSEDLTIITVLWNVLYNLGYMYTDGKNLYNYILSSTSQYYNLAFSVGDFCMRFFYSRYVPKTYYSGASRYE